MIHLAAQEQQHDFPDLLAMQAAFLFLWVDIPTEAAVRRQVCRLHKVKADRRGDPERLKHCIDRRTVLVDIKICPLAHCTSYKIVTLVCSTYRML